MLRYDVRTIRQGGLTLEERVPPDDATFRDLALDLAGPVVVAGTLSPVGHGSFVWRGRVEGTVRTQCRRCLADIEAPFGSEVDALFTPASEATDDPAVYPLAEPVTALDLTEAVREEVGLAAPAYPLCRETCAGLCPRCGENRNEGPCACARKPEPV